MAHPIIGIWAVDIDFEGQHTFVTHAFHADGILHITADGHAAVAVWEATGERTFRMHGTRPIEPEPFQFIGWGYVDGDGEVSDGDSYTGRGDLDIPQPDGSRATGQVTLVGTRVVFAA